MTQKTTPPQSGSSLHSITSRIFSLSEPQTSTSRQGPIYEVIESSGDEVLPPPRHTHIADLVARYECDPQKRAAIAEGRREVARQFFDESDISIRAMRLRHGWSQAELARRLGTSQSHVARIEKGQEDVRLSTCQKLCGVLEIDLNQLGKALGFEEFTNKALR